MRYFVDVAHLDCIEEQDRWEQARALLYEKWSNEKTNTDILIRLLSECWYILVEWDRAMSNNKDLSHGNQF